MSGLPMVRLTQIDTCQDRLNAVRELCLQPAWGNDAGLLQHAILRALDA